MLRKGWPLCYEVMVRYLLKFGNFYHYEAYIESQATMDGPNTRERYNNATWEKQLKIMEFHKKIPTTERQRETQ